MNRTPESRATIDLSQETGLTIHAHAGALFEILDSLPSSAVPAPVTRCLRAFDQAEKKLAEASSALLVSLNDWSNLPAGVQALADKLDAYFRSLMSRGN